MGAQANSIEVIPNGTRGGAIVWINGSRVGSLGAPWWGQADRPEHQLLTAHYGPDADDQQQVGDHRGMSYDEARAAVVERWRADQDAADDDLDRRDSVRARGARVAAAEAKLAEASRLATEAYEALRAEGLRVSSASMAAEFLDDALTVSAER